MKCIYAVILFPFFLHSCQSRNKKEDVLFSMENITRAKLLQKSEMRKDIVIELSYKGFG